jgi:aryl-alcohol dehydrogenase (NADP+)
MALAKLRMVSPAQIATAWVLGRPGVISPIIGATKVDHVRDAIAASELQLDADEIWSLEELYRPRFVGN